MSVLQIREETLLCLNIQLRPAFEDARFLVSCTLHLAQRPSGTTLLSQFVLFLECEYLTLDSICLQQKIENEHLSSQSYVIFIVSQYCLRI